MRQPQRDDCHRPQFRRGPHCLQPRTRVYSRTVSGAIVSNPSEGNMEKIKIEQHSVLGGLWCAGWLFTIGFLHLNFWKGLLAIILWAYYLGAHFSFLEH